MKEEEIKGPTELVQSKPESQNDCVSFQVKNKFKKIDSRTKLFISYNCLTGR